jgi:arsenate reductase-like glutaredoxin family protein
MRTYLIDLDNLEMDLCKEIMGFVLTVGLCFRKIDRFKDSKTGRTLFVQVETLSEEKALKEFLSKQGVSRPIVIKNDNRVILEGKKIGVFSEVLNPQSDFYLDNSTGKKFSIVR